MIIFLGFKAIFLVGRFLAQLGLSWVLKIFLRNTLLEATKAKYDLFYATTSKFNYKIVLFNEIYLGVLNKLLNKKDKQSTA